MSPENRAIILFLDLDGVFKDLNGIQKFNEMIQKFQNEKYNIGIVPISGVRFLPFNELQKTYEKYGLQKGLIYFHYGQRKMGAGEIICEHISAYAPAAWIAVDDASYCYIDKIPVQFRNRVFIPNARFGMRHAEVAEMEATLRAALKGDTSPVRRKGAEAGFSPNLQALQAT